MEQVAAIALHGISRKIFFHPQDVEEGFEEIEVSLLHPGPILI
jgi:hypothetical protein